MQNAKKSVMQVENFKQSLIFFQNTKKIAPLPLENDFCMFQYSKYERF